MTDLSFRERLEQDLSERYPEVLEAVDAGLKATKTVTVACPHCRKRNDVQVQDVRGSLEAARWLAEFGHGRPGVVFDDGDEDRITYYRVTVFDDVGPDSFLEIGAELRKIIEADEDTPSGLRSKLERLAGVVQVYAEHYEAANV